MMSDEQLDEWLQHLADGSHAITIHRLHAAPGVSGDPEAAARGASDRSARTSRGEREVTLWRLPGAGGRASEIQTTGASSDQVRKLIAAGGEDQTENAERVTAPRRLTTPPPTG